MSIKGSTGIDQSREQRQSVVQLTISHSLLRFWQKKLLQSINELFSIWKMLLKWEKWSVLPLWIPKYFFDIGVRSTLLLAPSPQRRQERSWKIEMILDGCFSVDANSGIPREQNKELTTTWASIYITIHEINARLACDAQPEYQSAKLKSHVCSTTPQSVTCHRMFQRVPWITCYR